MKKKILSLILCAVMLFTAVSCANPPGEGGGATIDPGVGVSKDTTPVTDSVPEAEPVDFSVLTEEELGRIQDALFEEIKKMCPEETITVRVCLNPILAGEEFDAKVGTRYEENLKLYDELAVELAALKKDLETFSAEGKGQSKEANELSNKIASVESKMIDLNEYGYAVNQIIKEERKPYIEAFADEYFPEQKDTVRIIGAGIMAVSQVNVTVSDIIMLSQNEKVMLIEKFGVMMDDFSIENSSSDVDPIDDIQLNEIYNLIDGEVAVL